MGGHRSTHIFCHAICTDGHLYAEDWKGKPHSSGESNEVRKWEYFFTLYEIVQIYGYVQTSTLSKLNEQPKSTNNSIKNQN